MTTRVLRVRRTEVLIACSALVAAVAALAACESSDSAACTGDGCTSSSTDEAGADSGLSADGGGKTEADGSDAGSGGPGETMTLASELVAPWHLALGGDYVYVVEGGGITKIPTSGGTPTKLKVDADVFIAADANNVYWTAPNGDVYQLAHSGGTPTQIGKGIAMSVSSLASDGTTVYWTESLNGGKVKGIAVGSNAVTVANDYSPFLYYPKGLAFVNGSIYVAESDGNQPDGTLKKLLPGASAAAVLTGRQGPSYPVSDGTHLFWWESNPGNDRIAGALLDGSGVATIASNLTHPTLAADSTNLYYVSASGGGIVKVPVGVSIGTPAPFYPFSYACEGLALDATSLYWADYTNGVLYKAPK